LDGVISSSGDWVAGASSSPNSFDPAGGGPNIGRNPGLLTFQSLLENLFDVGWRDAPHRTLRNRIVPAVAAEHLHRTRVTVAEFVAGM
jgi:hypothetical protein